MSVSQRAKNQALGEIKSLKAPEGYIWAGMPYYRRLFGRDSLIVAWQLFDFDAEIAKKTLEILARFQGKKIDQERDEEPGKILHEHQIGKNRHPRGFFPFPYYGSVDSTPLFLILFSFYYQKTGDKEFVKKLWFNALEGINWIFNFADPDGDFFLEYKRKRKTGLFHQGWKDGFKNHLKITPPVAIVEVQGYQYLALKEMSKMAKEIFNDQKLAQSLLKRAELLRKNFNKKFWLKKENYFALALDKEKKQKKEITSNPGHLLFTRIIESKEKERKVVKKLFSPELFTAYGIRTHSTKSPMFDPLSYHLGSVWPHDNWIIAQGLKKLGYQREYQKIKKALLSAFGELGFLPEFYGVVGGKITIKETKSIPAYPQAWASGALLNILTT